MQQIVLFILSFIVTLIIYELLVVKKAKKDKKNKPIEVKYLVNKYKVDLKKANYNQMLIRNLMCFPEYQKGRNR